MRCIIVDDDPTTVLLVEEFVKRTANLSLVGSFTESIDAVNCLHQEDIDVIFLDIEMPDMTGFELINSLANPPEVVLITAKEEYAVQAFDAAVADYLIKPIKYDRFLKAVNRVQQRGVGQVTEDAPTYFFVKTKGVLSKVEFSDITYLESMGDYIAIYTNKPARYVVNISMKEAEKRLDTALFARVHRSFIVSLKKISEIEENAVKIQDRSIPVSRSQRPNLLARLNIL